MSDGLFAFVPAKACRVLYKTAKALEGASEGLAGLEKFPSDEEFLRAAQSVTKEC